MASKGSIGIIREEAMGRIEAASARLTATLGVEPLVLPEQFHPTENGRLLKHARQLEAIAGYLETAADATERAGKKGKTRKRQAAGGTPASMKEE